MSKAMSPSVLRTAELTGDSLLTVPDEGDKQQAVLPPPPTNGAPWLESRA